MEQTAFFFCVSLLDGKFFLDDNHFPHVASDYCVEQQMRVWDEHPNRMKFSPAPRQLANAGYGLELEAHFFNSCVDILCFFFCVA